MAAKKKVISLFVIGHATKWEERAENEIIDFIRTRLNREFDLNIVPADGWAMFIDALGIMTTGLSGIWQTLYLLERTELEKAKNIRRP